MVAAFMRYSFQHTNFILAFRTSKTGEEKQANQSEAM